MRTILTAILLAGAAAAFAQKGQPETPERPAEHPKDNRKSEKEKAKKKKKLSPEPYYAAIGEGSTLPQSVLRLRLPVSHVTGHSGFDSDGKKQDLGFKVNALGTAFVLEYGATNRLALQFLAPYVVKNDLGMDGAKFAQSRVFQEKTAAFLAGVGAKLQAQGICPTPSACAALIQQGYALPVDTAVTLPTGETMTIKAGVPVASYAEALVDGAVRPNAGRTGLGDIEIGGLLSLVKTYNFDVALGLGVRFPTGAFAAVPASERAPGRGTTDLGLRFNIDFSPLRGVWLCYQNQSEFMLLKGKKKRSSLLDDTQLNSADTTSDATVAAGADGAANESVFERRGVRNLGFVKLAWGLGNVTQALAPLGLQSSFKYWRESEDYLNGVSQGPKATQNSVGGGFVLDGLAYQFPAQIAVDYDTPLSGTNERLATASTLVTLKAFYKF